MAASDVRYGISALGTDKYKVAEADELMVEKSTGKMFYKREDGRVVSMSEDIEHTRLCNFVASSFLEKKIEPNPDEFVIYHRFDTQNRVNMLSADEVELGIVNEFVVAKDVNGFFVRFHGTEEMNASVRIVDALTKTPVPNASKAIFRFDLIKAAGVTSHEEVEVPFDTITFIEIENTDNVDAKVVPKSIQYTKFGQAYDFVSATKKGEIKTLNLGNETFKVDIIDFITISAALTTTPIATEDRLVTLHSVIPMDDVSSYLNFIKSADEYKDEEVVFKQRIGEGE